MRSGNAAQFASALDGVIRTLERLAYVPRRVAVIAAPHISRLLEQQFRDGRDPYGVAWAPLRKSTLARGRRPPPLTDTGRLRGGTVARPRAGGRAGVELRTGAPYGKFAQVGFRVGTARVKPRRIFPDRGLPREWSRVLNDSARMAAREATRGS